MPEKNKRLGDAELEIMQVLWNATGDMTSTQVQEALRGKRDWQLSTLMTALARLDEKGFVCRDRTTRTNLYRAIVTEQAYRERESKTFLKKLYGNSLPRLVATLYDANAIEEGDLEELKALIEEIEGRHHHA